jgi:uncharacterized protein (DUF1697 family)
MTVHIALLRGVNVGGRQLVAMADLRVLLTGLGFENARSLLQSGNLVFESAHTGGAALESMLEAEVEKQLGLQTDINVRSAPQWKTIIAANPFGAEAASDPGRLVVMALKAPAGGDPVLALRAAIVGRERIEARCRELYIVYPDGIGDSRLTGALIERRLGVRGTARNWNTVVKLAALAGT